MKKKLIVQLFFLLMVMVPCIKGNAATTPDQAIAYVQSLQGQKVGSGQCVALIQQYYTYLGVPMSYGNGADYATNTLPAGWSRVQGGTPQKGDILVYSGNSNNVYGHVAIYESDRSTYHQNFDSKQYVTRVTYSYNRLGNPYWGYIRPNWNTHTHSYSSSVTTQPTCTQAGVRTYRCSCGSSYTEAIPATGHKYVNTVVAPTLTERGYTKHTCSVCKYSYTDTYVDPPKVSEDGWYYCNTLPSGLSLDDYTIEYDNYYEKVQANSPGADWKSAGTVKDEWQNSGSTYDSEQDLPTSNERVLVNSVYYHFCGPNAGAEGNYELTGNFVHYDGVAANSVTVTSSGMDGSHPYYLLNWNNGNGAVYCQSGVTCDGAYGSHGKRCRAWYKMNTYQNRVHVVQYKFTKNSGWTEKKDTSASSVKIRFKKKAPKQVSYEVVFMDGEQVLKTEEVLEGNAATAPACEKAGYDLSWDKLFDNVTSNLVVNAIWTEKKGNDDQETGEDNKNENTPPSNNTPSGDNKQDNALPTDNNKPSKNNSTGVGTNTTAVNKRNTVNQPKAQVAQVSGVTVRTSTDGTAKVIGLEPGKKNITIPMAVEIDGVKYYIESIGKKTFKRIKRKAVISINTRKPIKIDKNTFKGINTKKVVIKVNKEMTYSSLKRFKKILKKTGFKGKVKNVLM